MATLTERLLRPRGWLLLGAGVLTLGAAQWLGRRDLLLAAAFLLALPLLARLGLRLLVPRFTVRRSFSPAFVETGTTAIVTLDVRGSTPSGGQARLVETLPAHLRAVHAFDYPRPVSPHSLLSRYSYPLRPTRRGVFRIGPLSAAFSDPFDVAVARRTLDAGDLLTVAPAAVVLPELALTSGRGQDGSHATWQQANPSDDDVMNRDYRHGDPLRRIHWPATARQGKLMVRAEESVTTPEAALILDRRLSAYGGHGSGHGVGYGSGGSGGSGGLGGSGGSGGLGGSGTGVRGPGGVLTTPAFEWAVVAGMSIAAHLLERGYSLRVLDQTGYPGFATSPSAEDAAREDFWGPAGVLAVAQSLAALELTGPEERQVPVSERLIDRLVHTRRRGPLLAVTGLLTPTDARILAAAAETAEGASALLVCPDPAQAAAAVTVLRRAGWQALAVTPTTDLAAAWADLAGAAGVATTPTTGSASGEGAGGGAGARTGAGARHLGAKP